MSLLDVIPDKSVEDSGELYTPVGHRSNEWAPRLLSRWRKCVFRYQIRGWGGKVKIWVESLVSKVFGVMKSAKGFLLLDIIFTKLLMCIMHVYSSAEF